MPIHRDIDRHPGQTRVQTSQVHGSQAQKPCRAVAYIAAVGGEQPSAERLHHARAAIVHAAVAAPNENALRAEVERGPDEVAHAATGRQRRIASCARNAREPASRSNFQDGSAFVAVAEKPDRRRDPLIERSTHIDLVQDATSRLAERACKALAAVGNGRLQDCRIWPCPRDALRHRVGNILSIQALLEPRRRNENGERHVQ